MSREIDERIVEMRFDNRQFESNVQTSLSTLENLKQSLKMDGASKGLENVGAAAKDCDMSPLTKSVETVRMKFSALEVIAVTALANITNSVINAGKQLAKTFAIDPIVDGFKEYVLKMGSIQTMMMGSGASLSEVNGYLDELNTYADKTIYSFADMTSNIGKFTNAGVSLKDSVLAIQGVSNAAAVSGANANEASRAMYNFAQALSAGYVKLIDWKSIENANMATVEFKTQLLEAAVAAGTVARTSGGMYKVLTKNNMGSTMGEAIDATHSFNDSLQHQWLTTEVLVNTLRDYADETTEIGKKAFAAAQDVKTFSQLMDTLKEAVGSGWAMTWEVLFGDFNEAKELWTGISNVVGGFIDSQSQARNDLLKAGLSSGWKQFLDQGISDSKAYEDIIVSVAKEHGVAIEDMLKECGNFEKTLKQGWLTSDILSESLTRLTDKTRGLSDEELEAAGYTRKQAEELEKLEASVKDGSVSIEEFTEKINRASGRENVIEGLKNTFEGLISVVSPIKNAFNEIFPPATAEQLYILTERFREFTSKLKLGKETAENLKNTFKGVFAVLDILGRAFSSLFNFLPSSFGVLGTLSGGFLGVTGAIGQWLVKLDEAIKESDIFNKAVQGIITFINKAKNAIVDFAGNIKEKFGIPGFEEVKASFEEFIGNLKEKISIPAFEGFGAILDGLKKRIEQVKSVAGEMKAGLLDIFKGMGESVSNCNFVRILEAIWNAVKRIAGGITTEIGKLAGKLTDGISNADFSGLIDLLNGLSIGGIALGINRFFSAAKKAVDEGLDFKEQITDILDSVRGCFEAYQTQLKAGALLKIASAMGILAASILVISLIDSDKLNSSLGAMTVLFADLMASMAVFSKISGIIRGVFKSVFAMLGISAAVFILAGALKTIGDLDLDQIENCLIGIGGLTAIVVAAAKIMGTGTKAIIKCAAQMVIFSAALKILVTVCEDLSELDWEQLTKGLTGVGVLLAEVALFLRMSKFSGKAVSTAAGIVVLSVAIGRLAVVCGTFAQMRWEELGKGLTAIGALLAEISVFTRATGNAKHVISTGAALLIIAQAMKTFVDVINRLDDTQWNDIAKGLAVIGGVLASIAVSSKVMPKNMIGISLGLIGVGAALEILANVMQRINQMEPEQIEKALITIGVALVEFAVALNLMKGTLSGSAALTVASLAIAMLTPSLIALGRLGWEDIAKGLIAVAGAFTVIGIAGAVLTPLVPAILGLAGSFALIGVGILGIGAGLLAASAGLSALAVGFAALAASGVAGATAVVASLTVIITGIAALIPAVMEKIGEGIIALCKVIAEGAPAIGEACKAIVITFIDVLRECVPEIADGVLFLLTSVLSSVVEYTPKIVDLLMQFLIKVLDGIAGRLPELIQSAVGVIMAFFSGVTEALSGIDVDILLKGIVGIGLISAIMLALNAVASLVPGAMVGVLGAGLIIAEIALVLAAVGALAQIPGLNWLIGEGGKLLENVGVAIGSFIGGIIGGLVGGVTGQFPQIATDLSNFMNNIRPFIEGAGKIDAASLEGVRALAETILILTAADVLQGLTSWLTGDKASMAEFGSELAAFGPYFNQYYESVKGVKGDVVQASANAAKTLAEMAAILPNSGGLAGWFAGENSLSAFAEELVLFGPKLKEYAESVSGLDSNVVVNSANAASAMAEMAGKLPNSGGVLAEWIGDNTLASFANELATFGPKLKEYAESVSGLDKGVVENSAAAALTLAELSDKLPNSGGAVSWFTGDNDLSTFGENLVSFGENFAGYSAYMEGVKPDILTATTSAVKAMIEIQNGLKESGGILSGNTALSKFGYDLSSFGYSLSLYYSYIEAVDPTHLAAVTTETNGLAAMIRGLSGLDTAGASSFGKAIGDLGRSGVDKFIEAFDVAGARAAEAASKMLAAFAESAKEKANNLYPIFAGIAEHAVTAIESRYKDFTGAGRECVAQFIAGVKSQEDSARSAFNYSFNAVTDVVGQELYDKFYSYGTSIADNFAKGIEDNSHKVPEEIAKALDNAKKAIADTYFSFADNGREIIGGFKNGLESKANDVKKAGTDIAGSIILAIDEKKAEITLAGQNIVSGLVNGVSSKMPDIVSKARNLATTVLNTMKSELDIHSPSGETEELGEYTAEGYIEGITKSTPKVKEAVTDAMIAGVLNPMRESIDSISKDTLFGAEAADKLAKSYAELMEEFEDSGGIRKADKLIYDYGRSLYRESKQYEKDTENIEKHRKKLEELIEKRTELQEQLEEQSKKNTKESKKKVKTIENNLEKLKDSISDAYETIKADEDSMVEHMKETYSEFRSTLSDTISESIDPLKASLDNRVELLKSGLDEEIDIFGKFEKDADVTAEGILSNMKTQLEGISEWRENLNKLSGKGLDRGLLDSLAEMGTSGAGYVEAFLSMTQREIELANENFQNTAVLSNEITTQQILDSMEAQVTGVKEWNDSLNQLSQKGFANGIIEQLKELGTSGAGYVRAFMSMTGEEMQRANAAFRSSSRLTSQALLSNFEAALQSTKDWISNIQQLANTGLNKGIVDALGKMGVSGAEYVNAFLSMTAEEIERFNENYAEYLSFPDDAADTLIASFASSGVEGAESLAIVLGGAMEETNETTGE